MYYLRARHYDGKTGRFTQEDTYLGDGRNLYAYVHSNPLKYVDPTGHTAEEIFEPGSSLVDDLQDKSCDGGNVRGNNGTNSGSLGRVTNPYGKLGSPEHSNTVTSIKATSAQGDMVKEARFSTPNGSKSYRCADVVEVVNGNVTNIYQVGKVNQNGTPVSREVKAINDIMASPDYNGARITFIPYNSSVEAIIFQ